MNKKVMANTITKEQNSTTNKQNKRFSNINVMDYLVIICILSIQVFVGVVLFFYYKNGMPPPLEVMQYFFAFFGGELLAMATITIVGKVSKPNKMPTEILEEMITEVESEEEEEC